MSKKTRNTASGLRGFLDFLKMRFGMSEECLLQYTFSMDDELVSVTSERLKHFKASMYVQKGVAVLKLASGKFKITLEGAQLLGGCATKNTVALSKEEAFNFLRGKDIKKALDNVCPGQVIIRLGSDSLAPGLYRNGIIKNQIPAGKRLH